MKALVLSGGSGTRFRPFSNSMPKQLMPVANQPVLEHVLGNIHDIGITDVGIVVGDHATKIAEAFGDGSRLGLRVRYLQQDRPRGLADGVRLARGFLGDDDFVLYLGDNLLADGVADIAANFVRARPAAQLVVQKVADPRAYGVAELDGDGAVLRLVEKPPEPRSDLALIGVYFFTAAIHEAVDAIRPSARGELEITDAIQWLLSNCASVNATEYAGYWKDVGTMEDLLDCNTYLLAGLRPGVAGYVDDASEIEHPVVVEPGARIVRSRIVGPAVIGANSQVEDSHIGPNVAVGRGCRLSSTHVSDSVVLDGACVTEPHIRDCVAGRGALVATRRDTVNSRAAATMPLPATIR
jgi:glucose-1-phosphate thymidylyltransferase